MNSFEEGVLDALAVVEAGFCDAPEPPAAFRRPGADVVGDDDEHGGSPPEEGRIGIQVSPEIAGQEQGLRMGQQADGDLVAGVEEKVLL